MGCASSSEGEQSSRKQRSTSSSGELAVAPVPRVDLAAKPSKSALRSSTNPNPPASPTGAEAPPPGAGKRRVSWATDETLKKTADDIIGEEGGVSTESHASSRRCASPPASGDSSLIQTNAELLAHGEDGQGDDQPDEEKATAPEEGGSTSSSTDADGADDAAVGQAERPGAEEAREASNAEATPAQAQEDEASTSDAANPLAGADAAPASAQQD